MRNSRSSSKVVGGPVGGVGGFFTTMGEAAAGGLVVARGEVGGLVLVTAEAASKGASGCDCGGGGGGLVESSSRAEVSVSSLSWLWLAIGGASSDALEEILSLEEGRV